jgi:hypothetical protein
MAEMAQMALEVIFRILILIVVVAVVIGMILTFRDQIAAMITQFLQQILGQKPSSNFPIVKDSGSASFSSGEIATYIQSCYSTIEALSPADRTTTNCYILTGNFNANANSIRQSILDSNLRNNLNITTDFSRGVATIQYLDPQGIILVK